MIGCVTLPTASTSAVAVRWCIWKSRCGYRGVGAKTDRLRRWRRRWGRRQQWQQRWRRRAGRCAGLLPAGHWRGRVAHVLQNDRGKASGGGQAAKRLVAALLVVSTRVRECGRLSQGGGRAGVGLLGSWGLGGARVGGGHWSHVLKTVLQKRHSVGQVITVLLVVGAQKM